MKTHTGIIFAVIVLLVLSATASYAAPQIPLRSAKPTVQVQLSHSPVLEDDLLEVTIRAKDDRGVKVISIAHTLSNQPIIENCQVNGRSLRTCEKTFTFR